MRPFSRELLSLDGEWGFYVDPMRRGVMQEWWKSRRDAKSCFPCYDVYSRTVTVPHNWCSEPDLRYYEGTCLYEKIFDYTLVEGTRTYITFGAVNFLCDIYLNGSHVSRHDGGYLEFTVEVTDYIREEANDLWLVVDNTRHVGRIPAMIFDWWNDGGILRDVEVYSVARGGIEDYRVTTSLTDEEVLLSVTVRAEGEVTFAIDELGVRETFVGSTTITLPRDKVELYSDRSPYRYLVEVSNVVDSISEYIGLREVRVEGAEILLNGEPLFLKGINVHEDFLPLGSAENPEAIDKALGYCRELGVNWIRLAHYPHSRYFMEKAEQMGFLMSEEIPLYWHVDWESGIEDKARAQYVEMVERDFNRASVIMWGVGNEMNRSLSNAEPLYRLGKYLKSLDDSRLTSYVCSNREKEESGGYRLILPDYVYEPLDVICANVYSGMRGETYYDNAEQLSIYSKFNKPILVTETGAFGVYGVKDGTVLDEDIQAECTVAQINAMLPIENMCGVCVWVLYDGRTPIYMLSVDNGWHFYGVLTKYGERKPSFYALRDLYDELPDRL